MDSRLAAILFLWAFVVVAGDVKLRELSFIYIPYDYAPEARHAMFTEASEQISHDPTNHLTYTIGK